LLHENQCNFSPDPLGKSRSTKKAAPKNLAGAGAHSYREPGSTLHLDAVSQKAGFEQKWRTRVQLRAAVPGLTLQEHFELQ
jgi:hypothetical protein